MSRGRLSGDTKGSYLFGGKDWRAMTAESYCEKIIPLVYGWIAKYHLMFVQDNTPCYLARNTIRELQDRGLTLSTCLHSLLICIRPNLFGLGWKILSKPNILIPVAGNDYHLRSFVG